MKKIVSRMLGVALLSVCLLAALPSTAYAAGVGVGGGGTYNVGDTFTVSVSFSADNIGAVQAGFSYDGSVIQYQGGAGTSNGLIVLNAGAEGQGSLSASISFKAVGAGSTSVSVSIQDIIDFEGNGIAGGSGGTSITVVQPGEGGNTEEPGNEPAPNEPAATRDPNATPAPTQKPVPEREVAAALGESEMYVWHAMPGGVEMPEGFEKTEATFAGEKVAGAYSEAYGVTLVYATDAQGGEGRLYLQSGEGNLFAYIPIRYGERIYIVLPLPEGVEIPEGFVESTLKREEEPQVPVWVNEDDIFADFYLLYAVAEGGQAGFYLHDGREATLQRYVERRIPQETVIEYVEVTPQPTARPTPTPEPTEDPELARVSAQAKTLRTATTLLAVLGVCLLAGVIVLVVLRQRGHKAAEGPMDAEASESADAQAGEAEDEAETPGQEAQEDAPEGDQDAPGEDAETAEAPSGEDEAAQSETSAGASDMAEPAPETPEHPQEADAEQPGADVPSDAKRPEEPE